MFNKSLIAFAAAATISTVVTTVHADSLALTVVDMGSAVTPITYSVSAASGYAPVSSNGTQNLGNFQYNISDVADLGVLAMKAYSFDLADVTLLHGPFHDNISYTRL